jgi:hypothetical protein
MDLSFHFPIRLHVVVSNYALGRTFLYLFISMALPAHSGPRPLIEFRNLSSQTVGLLGRVISPSQGRCLNTGQHKHKINAYTHTPIIHAVNGIRTHDPSVRASGDSSCLRPCGYCDQQYLYLYNNNMICDNVLHKHFFVRFHCISLLAVVCACVEFSHLQSSCIS